jgi:hypothetical protein
MKEHHLARYRVTLHHSLLNLSGPVPVANSIRLPVDREWICAD